VSQLNVLKLHDLSRDGVLEVGERGGLFTVHDMDFQIRMFIWN